MAVRKRDGIADDASAYEDLPEPEDRPKPPGPPRLPKPRNASGIASDARLFEGMLEETSDSVRSLESQWLYQKDGAVFGPVKPKELLEMLYRGELNAESPIAPEDGEFLPLRRIGAFRSHLPKVEAHQRDKAEAERQHQDELMRLRRKRIAQFLGVGVLTGVLGVGLYFGLRYRLEQQADAERLAKEAEIQQELDSLMSSVTIEPPLLAQDEPEAETKGTRPRRRKVVKFSGSAGPQGTEELTRHEIMGGVAQQFPGIKRCIVEQMQRDAESVPEEVVLTFAVSNDGLAQDVSLADRHLRKAPIRDCLAQALGKVRWRKYKGEVRNVEYPITIGRS